MELIKMYHITVQNKNDLDNSTEYTVGEKEKEFLLRVFGNSHYYIKVEELFYSQEDSEEKA